jgi:glutamate dehydrogenase (NAD(P)+)
MHERGILSVPDFIANAGGVICASTEYHGGNEQMALQTIESKIRANVTEVLSRAHKEKCEPRVVAVKLAVERVKRAMALRRWN